jgi:site-specific DNA recombinase
MRALIYCRVSEDRRQGRSVAQQEAECRATCDDEGWEIVEVITDNDVGASRYSKGKRPGWARVLSLVEAGDVDVLVTWEGSRAQRDLASYSSLRELCISSGVKWHYGGRTHDMSDWRDRRDTGRDAVDDEAESGRTSERIRRDVRAAALAGRPHGRRLFGYQRVYDPSTGALVGQEPHPDEAPVVRQIFADFLGGKAARTIARELNDAGITTGTGARWADTQVKRVLTNPAYSAQRVHQGEVIGDATWPPLAERETFDRVQARFEGRRGVRQTRTARLLTGVARCGTCSSKLHVGHDIHKRKMYQCRNGFHVARDERHLDGYVTAVLLERLARPDVAETMAGTPDPANADLRARAADLKARLDAAVAEFTAGRLSATTLAKIEQEMAPKIAEAERAARAALVPLEVDLPAPERVASWWEGLPGEQRREVVAALVSAVVVNRTRQGGRRFDPTAVEVIWR